MPAQYEAIRDKAMSEGMSKDKAQSKAAAIYNSKHPNNPVTGKHDKTKKMLKSIGKR
jgi:hypothetical protein